VAFARVRSGEAAFAGVGEREFAPGIATDLVRAARGADEVADWNGLRTAWARRLQALAAELGGGVAAVRPQPGACERCDLQPLCRIGHASAGEGSP
jgi:hypothetical protein